MIKGAHRTLSYTVEICVNTFNSRLQNSRSVDGIFKLIFPKSLNFDWNFTDELSSIRPPGTNFSKFESKYQRLFKDNAVEYVVESVC